MAARPFPKVADTTLERRQHIVRAAAELIAQNGIEGASIRLIAQQAGCSRGLVEHYFDCKSDLLIEANRWANESYLARVESRESAKSGLQSLRWQLHELLPYNEQILNEWRVRSVFLRQGSTDWAIEQDSNSSFGRIHQGIAHALREACEAGEIPADTPTIEASENIFLLVIGIATICLIDARMREQSSLDRRVEMIIATLVQGSLQGLRVGDPTVEY